MTRGFRPKLCRRYPHLKLCCTTAQICCSLIFSIHRPSSLIRAATGNPQRRCEIQPTKFEHPLAPSPPRLVGARAPSCHAWQDVKTPRTVASALGWSLSSLAPPPTSWVGVESLTLLPTYSAGARAPHVATDPLDRSSPPSRCQRPTRSELELLTPSLPPRRPELEPSLPRWQWEERSGEPWEIEEARKREKAITQ